MRHALDARLGRALGAGLETLEDGAALDEGAVDGELVGPGPLLERFKAGARGSAKPRVKRMSHLRIVLTDGKSN